MNPSRHYPYAYNAIDDIELANCMHGCQFAEGATPEEPGGSCSTIVKVILEEDIPELSFSDDGRVICSKRIPLSNA